MGKAGTLSRSVSLRGAVKPEPIDDIERVLERDPDLGREIKLLRKASGATLAQLSAAAGLSQGHLSQIERGVSSPSIRALHAISRALGVTISWFFKPQSDQEDALREVVVRRNRRRSLSFESGVKDELLSPNLGRKIELLRCTFAPGSQSGGEPYAHAGEEAGILVSGALTLWLDGRRIELETGDSFAFESTLPHRYANEGEVEAVVIWAITPPSY